MKPGNFLPAFTTAMLAMVMARCGWADSACTQLLG
jgi:hypothetical protein